MGRAEMRRIKRESEKSETRRFYTEAEMNAEVDRRVKAYEHYLQQQRANEIQAEFKEQIESEWEVLLQEHSERAWSLMMNSAIWVLHRKFGWGKIRCERFAEAVADIYNNEPDLLQMQKDIENEIELKVGIEDDPCDRLSEVKEKIQVTS